MIYSGSKVQQSSGIHNPIPLSQINSAKKQSDEIGLAEACMGRFHKKVTQLHRYALSGKQAENQPMIESGGNKVDPLKSDILLILAEIQQILDKFEKIVANNALKLQVQQANGVVTQMQNFVTQAYGSADQQLGSAISNAVGGALTGIGTGAMGLMGAGGAALTGAKLGTCLVSGLTLTGAGLGANMGGGFFQENATRQNANSQVNQSASQELSREYGNTDSKAAAQLNQLIDELNKLFQSFAAILEAAVVK